MLAVERYFQVSLFLLVTAGFTTLATTGKLDAISLIFVFAALTVRGYLLARNRELLIPERWTSYVTLLYGVFYAADYFFLAREFVAATVHLVLFAMVIKIFSVHRDRDYLYLAVLAFLEVLAASVLTVDAVFLVAFAAFVLLAVNTFISFEMRRSAHAASVRARESAAAARTLPRALSSTGFVLVVMIMVIAAAIFFVLPRLTAGYLSAFAPQNELVTGFRNEVNLGRIGEIKRLSTVVMHVQIYGDHRGLGELKLRGISLGLFDGRRWTNPAQSLRLTGNYGFDLAPLYPRWQDTLMPAGRSPHFVRYRVLMEPVGTNVFFVAPKPQQLLGRYREILADDGGALFNADREREVGAYEVVSVIAHPSAAELRAAARDYPPGIELRYLQLPPRLDRRVRDLAQQITADAATRYDKAVALESYLRARYGYTLQLPASAPADPVGYFLFERKQGHCELFASAMTLMLRTLGIPARLVNGFRGGEFNDLTGSYIIRAHDAHTWVEAYFPGSGWVSFDPTPADPSAIPGAWTRFLLYVDAGREFWREWIINYDFSHQRSLTASTLVRGRRLADVIREAIRVRYSRLLEAARRTQQRAQHAPATSTAAVVLATSALLLALNAPRLWRALRSLRLARHPERAPQSAASVWYERLLRMLSRRGWRKLPTQTPAEFCATIGDPALRRAVADFTAHYERARFGQSSADALRLPQLFAMIKSG